MPNNTTEIMQPQEAVSPHPGTAAAAAVVAENSVASAVTATALAASSDCNSCDDASDANCTARLHTAAPRKRKRPSAKPLEKFRATGVATWDKAQQYEWDAIFAVGQFGLLSVRQLGEWVFKNLSTAAARHRQAQALTLRLCRQAQATSVASRLARVNRREPIRAFGRKKVGASFYYFLNAAGMRYMQQNFDLVLPDASKSLTTASDMAKRALVFEHCVAMHRADPDFTFVGPAALAADVHRQRSLKPLERAVLSCLANLRCAVRASGRVTYTYVADRAGSSDTASVAYYRELARVASLVLGRAISIEVIGRRMPAEVGVALKDTQLARALVKASLKEVFWTEGGRYRADKLTAFFTSLRPHATSIRSVMERHRA